MSEIIKDNAAIKKLMTYDFPGNIRELKAVIEVAVVLAENNFINEVFTRYNPLKFY